MKTNQAKELLLLSAVAFKQGNLEQVSQLYAAALSSDDMDELVTFLQSDVAGTAAERHSLSSIAREIEESLSADDTQIKVKEVVGEVPETDEEDLEGLETDEFGASVDDEVWTDEQDEEDPTELIPVTSLSTSSVAPKTKIRV